MKDQKTFDFEKGELLLINKPLHWTSFNVVDKIRRIINTKVGHAGTLDPLATGLLILATGASTKTINQIQTLDKTYTGTMTLGACTPSYDAETPVSETFDITGITEQMIRETVQHFIGAIEQIPPVYSAIKVNGERLYKKARKQQAVQVPTRMVNIYKFDITNIDLPKVAFKVSCSKGTYIRSLAYDFGKALNNGAYLSKLKRTKIGDHTIEDAWEMDNLVKYLNSIKSDNESLQRHRATCKDQ